MAGPGGLECACFGMCAVVVRRVLQPFRLGCLHGMGSFGKYCCTSVVIVMLPIVSYSCVSVQITRMFAQ